MLKKIKLVGQDSFHIHVSRRINLFFSAKATTWALQKNIFHKHKIHLFIFKVSSDSLRISSKIFYSMEQ